MLLLSLRSLSFEALVLGLVSAGCAAEPVPRATSGAPGPIAPSAQPARSPKPTAGTARKAPPDPAAIYARLEPGLSSCYAEGRNSTPEMTDGKLTLDATIDASGAPSCVIPTDQTGLTQGVVDCMTSRFAREKFDGGPPWTTTVPITLRGGALKLGERKADAVVMESVETIRMPDAFDVLESLEPELLTCVRGKSKSSSAQNLLVAARVGADGRTECALTSGPATLPQTITECASAVLRTAHFPPPKRGTGYVLVPLIVLGAK